MRTTTAALCATLFLAMAAPVQAGDQWQVGTAPSFSSGRVRDRFPHRRLLHADHRPPVVRRRRPVARVSVHLHPRRRCRHRRRGRTRPHRHSVPLDGTSRDTTQTRTDATAGTTAAPRATHCGMGDIVMRGRYYVVDERGWIPTIAVRGHIKAPTADDGLGLGTGRPDEGFGLEISRMFGATTAMVDGGYTVIGKPAGLDFNNVWWYDVGLGQDLAGDRVNISVFFEEYPGDSARTCQRPGHPRRAHAERRRLAAPTVGRVRTFGRRARSRVHLRSEPTVLDAGLVN